METAKNGRGVDGVVPVVPIPFGANEAVDEHQLRRLIDFAVSAGVGAVCLPAYGSEFYKLSDRERARVVNIAIEQARGRLLVIAQANHGSARVAAATAREYAERGASLISVAMPRQFALGEDDLLRYLAQVFHSVTVPCLLQDFNPGGATVSAGFVARLESECPNFRYIKLEEPLMAAKVDSIRQATGGRVAVLEGWGGLYMMELIPAGICGIMPGLALADGLNRVFDLRRSGDFEGAMRLFEAFLPQIVFSLQNLELFLYCEKRLLELRGLLSNARCRSASLTPDAWTAKYVDQLNQRILLVLREAALTAEAR
jgi:4-hydroxy-tetrahydrodipicolinate synthase